MSQTTKQALASSLKKLLAERPIDKITVIDIVQDCEVNRQTFYYHFKDIYDLIEWALITDAEKILNGKKTYDTWQQGFLQLFEYTLKNKYIISNAYHSISRDQVERYLYAITYQLMLGVVEEKSVGMKVCDADKKFIADFYKFAFVGLMLDWIKRGMVDDPELIVNRLSRLIHGDITRALEKHRMDK